MEKKRGRGGEKKERARDREIDTDRQADKQADTTYQNIEVSEKFEFLEINCSFPICT